LTSKTWTKQYLYKLKQKKPKKKPCRTKVDLEKNMELNLAPSFCHTNTMCMLQSTNKQPIKLKIQQKL
jgi:hypothetical protein